jgi:branched-chain amino acid transport system substrate-binding protein
MDANAIASTIISKLGKKWYFLTPTMPTGTRCRRVSRKYSRRKAAPRPLAHPDRHGDYSAYLIKAKSFAPEVVINVMGGGDQVNSLKQFVQFGLDKQMAVAGTLCELESLRAMPDEARVGWWTMEWWWTSPTRRMSRNSTTRIKQRTGRRPPHANWFGFVSCIRLR